MNPEFLKKIKQKLQVGNARSIHLNSYPGRLATRLDIFELNNIKAGLADEFTAKLLSNPSFNFGIKIETAGTPLAEYTEEPGKQDSAGSRAGEKQAEQVHEQVHDIDKFNMQRAKEDKETKLRMISKRLSSIFYENEDTFLDHGIKTFGYGYPTLIYRSKLDPKKIISAPLFIWKLDISRDKNTWIFKKDEEYGIYLNDVLLNFLEQDLNSTGFVSITDDYLSDAVLDENEMINITNRLLKQISEGSRMIAAGSAISPMLDKEKRTEFAAANGNPAARFSGVFGLFRTQKEAVINDVKKLIQSQSELKFDKLETERFQKKHFSAVQTDPSQEAALKSLGHNDKLVIHGPPGTGKSQTLTAIIVNALFNGAKTLVVCEKRTALEVLQKNLDLLGLGGLTGLIEDVNRDRKKIVDKVREPESNANPIGRSIIDSIIAEAESNIHSINEGHRFYGKNILNRDNWSELTGKYISKYSGSSIHLELYKHIRNAGINFTSGSLSEDYNSRIIRYRQNEKLYNKAKDNIGILSIISDKMFHARSVKDVVLTLRDHIENVLKQNTEVVKSSKEFTEKYKAGLQAHYKDFYEKLTTEIEGINETYLRNCAVSRFLFNALGPLQSILLGVSSVFSKKHKALKRDKAEIIPRFNKLQEYINYGYFKAKLIPVSKSISEIEPQLYELKEAAVNWYKEIDQAVKHETDKFSLKYFNLHSGISKESIEGIEASCEGIIKTLNDTWYFNRKFEFKDESVVSKTGDLIGLSSLLEILTKDIDVLYDYSYWRNDYLANDEPGRKLIDELISLNSGDWGTDSEAWYIFNILLEHEPAISLRNDGLIDSLNENKRGIKKYQAEIIKEYWRTKQNESAEALLERSGLNINALYNKSRNSKFQKRNSLRRIIATDFQLFSDYFPVLLVNPTVCSSLFEMKEGLFDLVIFDEASQLRVEDVYSAKLRGKHKVVSGDENQMPPSSYFISSKILVDTDGGTDEEDDDLITSQSGSGDMAEAESLLEFAIRRGFSQTFLGIHYRSKHPDLIGFSNAAFYGSGLKPMPPKSDYKAVRYFQIGGMYNSEEGINYNEAFKVAQLINELVPLDSPERVPSIGVATFNVFQRNFILDMLNSRAEKEPAFAEKMNLIRMKQGEPFFVKNLENIQGDERDIIIISTTFGKKKDGSFLQNFGPINQEKGFRLLNVIITRAKHLMIVCTSIPEENISDYAKLIPEQGNRGRGIFYAYLAYAKSIELSDHHAKKSILDLLRKSAESEASDNQTVSIASQFENTVAEKLSIHIPKERIVQNYEAGGFKIDIAVLPAKDSMGKVTAIECDGSKFHNSDVAYSWDLFREGFLKDHGMNFVRIWSVNWWNNPERELKSLLEKIGEV